MSSDDLAPGETFQSLRALRPDVVLYNQCDPCDLQQGHIGDCWLISAMATMCEYPEFLQGLFSDHGSGVYTARLFSYDTKDFVDVQVDDSVPWQGAGYQHVAKFAHLSATGECWPCILEKCFAKLCGGYDNLNGAHPVHALGTMTGCMELELLFRRDNCWNPCAYVPNHCNPQMCPRTHTVIGEPVDVETLGLRLVEYADAGYLMAAASNSHSDGDAHTSDSGVVSGHAYTILQVIRNPGSERGLTLIRLRNPWGSNGEWKGAWSDNSSTWQDYPHVSEAVDHMCANNGVFWMTVEDFVKEFQGISICKFNPAGLGLTMPRLRHDVQKKSTPPNPVSCFRKGEMAYYIHNGNPNLKRMAGWGWTYENSPFNAWPSATEEGTVEIHCFRKKEMTFLCHEGWSGFTSMKGWGWNHESVAFYAYPPETSHIVSTINPPETDRTYSSVYNSDPAGVGHCRSMLGSAQAWSAAKSEMGEWMQMDLGSVRTVVGTVVQGRRDQRQTVTNYTVHCSIDGSSWQEVSGSFTLEGDRSAQLKHPFDALEARYVRLYVLEWQVHASMRAAVLVRQSVVPVHEFRKMEQAYYCSESWCHYDKMETQWGWRRDRIAFAVPPASIDSSIVASFQAWDQDGDGNISREEMTFVLQDIDPKLWTDERIEELLRTADTSGDGVLQYQEFVRWVCSTGDLSGR